MYRVWMGEYSGYRCGLTDKIYQISLFDDRKMEEDPLLKFTGDTFN